MSRLIPFCILHSAFCICLASPVPVRFNADAATLQTFQAAAYRGETLDIEARLTLRGAPFAVADGASATMHWQTNGMGAAWWTAPASVTTSGLVRARWTPAMDCGADAYRVFLGVADGGSNLSYRANMLLRMVGSPGAVPNELPMPVRVLDFSRITWTNEPWATSSGLTTNDVLALIDADAPVKSVNGNTGDVTLEVADITGAAPIESPEFLNSIEIDGNDGNPYIALGRQGNVPKVTFFQDYVLIFDDDGMPHSIYFPLKNPGDDDFFALASDIAASAAETRNWTARVYGDTNSWIAIEGKTLGFYSKTNSPSGPTTNTLWESSSALGGQLSDVALRATNNTTRINALESRPDLTSWGDYAPDGTPNPDAEAVLYLNKALTLMGSGFSWATSGAYACLCQSGAVAYHTETNGEVRIGLDVVSNYFGMVQGGSVTVGCMTHGIRVEGSGDNTIVHLLYAYAGGEFPAIWGMTSLAGDKTELSPVWTDYGDGTAEAAVPGHPFYFFTATSSRSMEARFESKAPAAFPGGIYGGFASPPVKYDTVITIQQGGHTYRIPAELVQ